jgi:murein L,D-transpeptidase YafK
VELSGIRSPVHRAAEFDVIREMNRTMKPIFFITLLLIISVSAFAAQDGTADKILIEKKARRLTLLSSNKVLKTYDIALGENPNGPKEREGDNKTPEGTYTIDSRNKNSGYHLSLHVSYPNEMDRKHAKELGISPGGNIMIQDLCITPCSLFFLFSAVYL